MLEHALLYDAQGQPLLSGKLNASREWAEVNAFCNRVYMPLAARPLVAWSDPNATLRTLSIGRIVLSRFCFGVPTKADDFDPSSGNIIVVNTMRGSVRHPLGDGVLVALAGRTVIALVHWQVRLLHRVLVKVMGILVGDLKSLAADGLDVNVLEVLRHGHDAARAHVFERLVHREVGGVALGGGGEVRGGLRQRDARLGHADELHGLHGGDRDGEAARVGVADVL